MWYFLLEHWWIATLAPYFGFNVGVLAWYLHSEDEHVDWSNVSSVAFALTWLLAGLWLIVAIVLARLLTLIYRAVRTTRFNLIWFKRAGIQLCSYTICLTIGVMIHVTLLSTLMYRPSSVELILVSLINAVFAMKITNLIMEKYDG